MRKFPFMPTAAAVVSDEDGHTLAIFFPQIRSVSDREMREGIKRFLIKLLKDNDIEAFDVREVGRDE